MNSTAKTAGSQMPTLRRFAVSQVARPASTSASSASTIAVGLDGSVTSGIWSRSLAVENRKVVDRPPGASRPKTTRATRPRTPRAIGAFQLIGRSVRGASILAGTASGTAVPRSALMPPPPSADPRPAAGTAPARAAARR